MFTTWLRQFETEVASLGSVSSVSLGELSMLRRVLDRCEVEFARLSAGASAGDLAAVAGVSTRRAKQAVVLGDALAVSPELKDAVGAGRVGLEQAQVLAPMAVLPEFAGAGGSLLDAAAVLTPGRLRSAAEKWLAEQQPDALADRHRRQTALRSLLWSVDGDGMSVMTARMTPEAGQVVRSAIGHVAEQSRLDGTGRRRSQRDIDALVALCTASGSGDVAGGRERPQVLITVDIDVLAGRAPGAGTDECGNTMTAEQAQRIACDADITGVVFRRGFDVLAVGRRHRTVTGPIYNALVIRDRGCGFPGCERPPAWCQAHHIVWWRHQGTTDLDNLVLLCSEHHHFVHDLGWTITGPPGQPAFHPPDRVEVGAPTERRVPVHDRGGGQGHSAFELFGTQPEAAA